MLNVRGLAIDGFDGSGKTTLLKAIVGRAEDSGWTMKPIAKSGPLVPSIMTAITSAIKDSDGKSSVLDPVADALLRAARMHVRLSVAASTPVHEYPIFDRWLISDLSMLDDETYRRTKPVYADLITTSSAIRVVFLDVDFETAWSRIISRPKHEWSPKELLGRQHLEKMHLLWQLGRERFSECGGIYARLDATEMVDTLVERIFGGILPQ